MYTLLDVADKYTACLIRILEVLASYLDLQNANSCSPSGNFWDRTSKYITTVSFHVLSNSLLTVRTLNGMHPNYWNCCPMNHMLHTDKHFTSLYTSQQITDYQNVEHLMGRYNSYSESPNKMQHCIKIQLFLILNEAQHVSGNAPPTIRSLKLHNQPLVLHTLKVVGRAVVGLCQVAYATWQRPTTARPTTFHVCKTRGWLCSFRLLMMGGVSPETCWASFKTRNNKIFIHCCT